MGADILKQELGTTSNSLSFWKCDSLETLKDTIKAILLSTTGIKTSQFFILSDDIIDKYGFKMDDTQPGIYSTRHKAKDTMSAYILIVSESDKQFEPLTLAS